MRRYNGQDNPPRLYQNNIGSVSESEHNSNLSPQQQYEEQQKISYFNSLLQNYMQNSAMNYDQQFPMVQGPKHNHEECETHNCSTGMISSLFEIVSNQASQLESLHKKVENMVQKNKTQARRLRELQMENSTLKNGATRKDEVDAQWKESINQIKVDGESVNKQSLLQILFGKQKYEYKLRLIEPFDQPLYRERNFSIVMELVDMDDQRVPNSNKIPMSLAMYSCQNPPKFIQKNTTGQKMLKGFVDQALINGVCRFEKIQIREVTSHYRGGWIFLVAIPCMTPLGANKAQNFINFIKIKPLVIDQVVVKAKKPKKKDKKKEQGKEDKEDKDDKDQYSDEAFEGN